MPKIRFGCKYMDLCTVCSFVVVTSEDKTVYMLVLALPESNQNFLFMSRDLQSGFDWKDSAVIPVACGRFP